MEKQIRSNEIEARKPGESDPELPVDDNLRTFPGQPTSAKQAIRYLENYENSKKNLFHDSQKEPELISLMDQDFHILWCNEASAKYSGKDVEEIYEQLCSDVWHCGTNECDTCPATRALKSKQPCYSQVNTTDGKIWDVSAFPLTGPQAVVSGILMVGREITASEKQQKELEQLSLDLEDKNRELEWIIHIASHDLRTPLVNIKGFSQEMERWAQSVESILGVKYKLIESDPELAQLFERELPENLKFIFTGIERIESLLGALLRLARLGKAALRFEPLDMNAIVSEISQSMHYEFNEEGITFEASKLLPCWGDRAQISQVFGNLISNSVKYKSPDRPGQILISCERVGDGIQYIVEDNGVGIAPSYIDKVFDVFFRIRKAGQHQDGEGIGLTIVKRVLARHKGTIRCESEEGKGTRFFVELPVSDPSA